jgi:wyosine [tRNA(Phe)-imidazoG37] synthetase (radical SAM superfamily)
MNEFADTGTVERERIIDFERAEKYFSCTFLENALFVHEDAFISCCASRMRMPGFELEYDAGDIGDNYIKWLNMKTAMTDKINNGEPSGCSGCPCLKKKYWTVHKKILLMVYMAGTQACNFRCIYCYEKPRATKFRDETTSQFSKFYRESKPRFSFRETFRFLRDNELLIPFVSMFDMCTGEPALYPERDDIFDCLLDNDYKIKIFTNAGIFMKKAAEALRKKYASIFVSIDSGTPRTFARIKATAPSEFDKVKINLRRYAECRGETGYVILKYLLLEGINDNVEDISGFVDICKEIKPDAVYLTCDVNKKGPLSNDAIEKCVLLAQGLKGCGIPATFDEDYFCESEQRILKNYFTKRVVM